MITALSARRRVPWLRLLLALTAVPAILTGLLAMHVLSGSAAKCCLRICPITRVGVTRALGCSPWFVNVATSISNSGEARIHEEWMTVPGFRTL